MDKEEKNKNFRQNFHPNRLTGGDKFWSNFPRELLGGILTCIVLLVDVLGTVAIIFKGELSSYLHIGIKHILIGIAINQIINCFTGNLGESCMTTSFESIPLLTIIVSQILETNGSLEQKVSSVIGVCMIESIIGGIILLILGFARLSLLIQYIPISVRNGAFCAIGYNLYLFAYNVMYDDDISINAIKNNHLVLFFLPHLIGVAFFLLNLFRQRAYNVPAIYLFFIIFINVGVVVLGYDFDTARKNKWLLDSQTSSSFYTLYTIVYGNFSFSGTFKYFGNIIVIIIIGPILNVSINAIVLSKMFKRVCDLDKQMKGCGASNIISGFGCGFPCHVAVSNTAFKLMVGGKYLLSSLVTGVLILFMFFIPETLAFIGFVPRSLLAGTFICLAIDFFKDSLYDSFFETTKIEYCIIPVILIVSAFTDLAIGLLTGIVLAYIYYIYKSSKSKVIFADFDCSQYGSVQFLPSHLSDIVGYWLPSVQVIQLSGFLFFGGANRLAIDIRKSNVIRFENPDVMRTLTIVIDFTRTSGIDTSAFIAMKELAVELINEGYYVYYVFSTSKYRVRMTKLFFHNRNNRLNPLFMCKSLDDAIIEIEDKIIERYYHRLRLAPIEGCPTSKIPFRLFFNAMKVIGPHKRAIFYRCAIDDIGKLVFYDTHHILFHNGDDNIGVFLLLQGKIGFYESQLEENEITDDDLHYSRTLFVSNHIGCFFGAMHDQGAAGQHKQTAQCLSDCILFYIPNQNYVLFTKDEMSQILKWSEHNEKRIYRFFYQRMVLTKRNIK